jgi:hypothetical protein
VHRIMINHFISSVRNRREYNDLDQIPELGIPAAQHDRTELRELNGAFQRLPKNQQEALHLIHWEFPRLCRGGSRSLTFPGVVSGHPSMKLQPVSRQSARTMEFHQWTSSRA